MNIKVIPIGNSAGIVLPKDLLAHLNVELGESLSVAKSPGSLSLRAAEDDFDAQMAAAREVMARRKRALRELAK
jgi:putative addiction module antidote